ncbi:MAG: enhanced intracellular survival protein Eis [Ktedonobacteraceae bacterium]
MSSLVVRPLASSEEYNAYFRLADVTFSNKPSEEDAQQWMRFLTQSPGFRAEQLRAAFRDGQLMGGCILHERALRMGAARISTGCIGAVVTSPDYRKQGIATALMQDTYDFARDNNHALLLLDGIPKFYNRYGYIDMFDVTAVEVDRSAILAQTSVGYHTRPATVDDAADILALYTYHYGDYTGSFERSLEFQAYRLLHAQRPPIVALAPGGHVVGYLFHGMGDEAALGREIAANDWDALLALLHYHAHLLDGENAPRTMRYLLPLDAPMTQWMIDGLEVPDTSQWHSAAQEWGVRGLTYHHRFTGWMGRLINFPAVMAALLPELQARWRRSLAQWTGDIVLTVAREAYVLRIEGTDVHHEAHPAVTAHHLELTPQALIQCIFGYRPLSRLADISHFPNDARSALAILFPPGHTWLPGTDWF